MLFKDTNIKIRNCQINNFNIKRRQISEAFLIRKYNDDLLSFVVGSFLEFSSLNML